MIRNLDEIIKIAATPFSLAIYSEREKKKPLTFSPNQILSSKCTKRVVLVVMVCRKAYR